MPSSVVVKDIGNPPVIENQPAVRTGAGSTIGHKLIGQRIDSIAKRVSRNTVESSRRASGEQDISCANDLDPSVISPKSERSVGINSIEATADDLIYRRMDGERSANGMCSCKPCLGEQRRLAIAPQFEQAGKTSCEQGCEGFGRNPAR